MAEAVGAGTSCDALADGAAADADEPTKTGRSNGGTREAVHATLPATAAATSTPQHNGRSRGRITPQIMADAKAPHCPARDGSPGDGAPGDPWTAQVTS